MRNTILISCLLFSWNLLAQKCIKGSIANRSFQNELMSAKEGLAKEFRDLNGLTNTVAQVGCIACQLNKTSAVDQKITSNVVTKECVEGALKRQVSQIAVICKNGNPVQTTNLTAGGFPCVTSDVSGYITHVSNKVLSCFNNLELKSGKMQIDQKTFFGKINNESGFNFSPSYTGGVGAGQLTSSAVTEMNVFPKSGKSANGRYILDALLNSKSSDCGNLKEFISEDKKNKISSPRKPICDWISMSRGLPKNLIYSVGYFAFLKDSLLKEMKSRKINIDDESLDKMALISYYRGPKKGKAYLREWKRNPSALAQVKQRLNNEVYIKAIRKKLNEVKDKSGGSCSLT